MNADLKAVILAAVPVVLGFVFATITASSITRKAERERMAFQKETELQKQRMELYKLLFAERLAAVKQISVLSSAVMRKTEAFYCSQDGKAERQAISENLMEATLTSNGIGWLLSPEVASLLHAIYQIALNASQTEELPPLDERGRILKKMTTYSAMLNGEVASLMRNDDLSEIVAKKSTVQ